ncbi:MAG: GNAT family N-acetyltransferase [Deltaproteobacteria bacterium]|nr:GNAT family N-acetyltransferase [Deltaproteobacteria bacterium]
MLPDEPRWVEAHGIAGDPRGWRRELGAGFALGHDPARLIVVAGDADAGEVAALARAHPQHTLLASTDELAAALRGAGRPVQRALLHTLPDPSTLPDLEGAEPLGDAPLDHAPPELADELRRARTPVWTAFVDGLASAFAYAPWRSPRWFDVSVDVLAGARQLGLGTLVAAAMIRGERALGREPVWGADEGNHASLRLAQRLGFVPVDELWVAPPA